MRYLAIFVLLLTWQAKPVPPKPKLGTSCALENHPVDVYNVQTKQYEERDNWSATCIITKTGDGQIVKLYEARLILPEFASLYEATTASGEFLKKTAPKLIKENKW